MTAAHCVQVELYGTIYEDPKYFSALFGEYNQAIAEPEEKKIQIVEIIIHPNWDSATVNNDIALARLEAPLDFNGKDSHLTPVCIGDERLPSLVGRNVINSGWGLTENSKVNKLVKTTK